MTRTRSLLFLPLICGCSAIPTGSPPPARIAEAAAEPLPLRLAVGSLVVELAPEEQPKEYKPEEVLDAEQARTELAAWVSAAHSFSQVRPANAGPRLGEIDEAWERRDDLFLSVRLGRFRTEFLGHNGWWVPNIINWLIWMVPAWFVATEEYQLGFTADVEVRSVDSNRVLHRVSLPIEATGTFDEFDRGWQFFGFVFPNNDADNWRQIATRLLPAARAELGAKLARELAGPFREAIAREEVRAEMQKTLALVVGISHYQDAVKLPPLPYAASDARGLADALTGNGLEPRQVEALLGSDATRERVIAALGELRARARPGDQVLVYFAGYGTRGVNGEALLLLEGAGDGARLTLAELGQHLREVEGEKLVVLDCGFDGQARSVQSGRPRPADPQADARVLSEATGGATLVASGPGSSLLAPEHLGASLFTYHLIRGLSGEADKDENGTIALEELFALARRSTVAESAYFGSSQEPVATGLQGGRFVLPVPQRAAPRGTGPE